MPGTYTNRKGTTYYLCRGTTKTGKPRFFFAREQRGEPVEQVPDGYEIRESVNGVVSLAKKRPARILPEEQAAVEAEIGRHPKAHNYRVAVKGKQIVVYERIGADVEDLLPLLRRLGDLTTQRVQDLGEMLHRGARFTPVLRFTLSDEEKRTFYTERRCYLGSIDNWIQIGPNGPLRPLARRFIPLLGTDALYDVIC